MYFKTPPGKNPSYTLAPGILVHLAHNKKKLQI